MHVRHWMTGAEREIPDEEWPFYERAGYLQEDAGIPNSLRKVITATPISSLTPEQAKAAVLASIGATAIPKELRQKAEEADGTKEEPKGG